MEDFLKIRDELISFYKSKETLSYGFRIKMLKQLKLMVSENLEAINKALWLDLNKSEYESYLTEVSMLYSEIDYFIKRLKKLMQPKKVKKSLVTYPARGYIMTEPYGLVLIMSPWNYPLQLALIPLAGSIAGGNVSILKMSEYSVNTSNLLADLIKKYFPESYIKVISGDSNVGDRLLDLRFDKIFFTGSKTVGKIVLAKAAKYLTPCDLELGGKSPVVVTKNASLELAAKRIIWGKLLNAGETCVAPDYILCDELIKDRLLALLIKYINKFLGSDPLNNLEYPKIINKKSYDRLKELALGNSISYGGRFDDEGLKLEPTILVNPSLNSRVMTEEIFGPILPIITYKDLDYAYSFIEEREKPLAFYIFSNDKKEINRFLTLSFGGGAVNDTILHMTPLNLPFGGAGESGMGSYHGAYTYKAFTREKSVLRAKPYLDLSLRYHPYLNKINILKKLFK